MFFSFVIMSIFVGLGAGIATTSMSIANRACFGAGCYWGTGKMANQDYSDIEATANVYEFVVGTTNEKKNFSKSTSDPK